MNKSTARWLMILTLLIAAALRIWRLPAGAPLGLHYDEAANVILTRQIAIGEYRPLFIHAYTGKEVLFFYAAAPWMRILDGAAWGGRLGAAMLGFLTVAATYAATRALLGAERRARAVAVFAAGWMAVAFPHVLLSRYGFRAISQPLLQALTVAAMWWGLRTGKRRWLLLGGLFLGLTGYTYLAARLFPLPLGVASLIVLYLTPPGARARCLRQLGYLLAAAVIAFAPLGWHFVHHPDAFTTRIDQVAASSGAEAWRGLIACLRALGIPGAGDPYVRFNQPGRPVMPPLAAVLALLGLAVLFQSRQDASSPVDRAGRWFLWLVLPTMLLPSALATSEITPSNLRLIGLFPFLALLPAMGLVQLHRWLDRILGRRVPLWAWSLALLLIGGGWEGQAYAEWATSAELFYAADGEMTLAAEALDRADRDGTAIYIASEHYRHPTVAALATSYKRAKWLTGGANLVLPSQGDAVYLWPASLALPAPWPEDLAVQLEHERTAWLDPDGAPALWQSHVSSEALAALRPSRDASTADFAHVIHVHDARALAPCRAGATCPVLVTWEVRAPYPALQLVVRVTHRRTGEWARVMPFHYPTEEWTVGEMVFDQFELVLPSGIPPGEAYQISVGAFNPEAGEALPRLTEERFAGLDVRFPLTIAARTASPAAAEIARVCSNLSGQEIRMEDGLRLLGWQQPPETLRQGEPLPLTLCWQAEAAPREAHAVTLTLQGATTSRLYAGPPAGGYTFDQWLVGEFIEDRYRVRLPRDLSAGAYDLTVRVGSGPTVVLGDIEVRALERTFAAPPLAHPMRADFGEHIQLLGYETTSIRAGQPLTVTLAWRALRTMSADYTRFVHLADSTGRVWAQVDGWPRQGRYPTSLWMQDEVVVEQPTLLLPDDLPPGPYTLRVGFYLQSDGTHLPVNGEEDGSLVIHLKEE